MYGVMSNGFNTRLGCLGGGSMKYSSCSMTTADVVDDAISTEIMYGLRYDLVSVVDVP